ncbi:Ohr family peroxiredoxin [Phycicoccus sp. CSK15P-2]|uniref:Ohr family peroxiredoxin n=1 Tax=Phycicoccus sp. CSK15P-2 TaxID=2807627 RepID=UPI0027DE85F3|nr:Ohr family peroxiredoxin [Phycicoccus sp. CSK15P-2]
MPHEAVNKKLYSIAATATGGREGHTKSEDGVVDLPLGKPSTSNPVANPETLFAAGYAACYNGALALIASREGVDASGAETTADVTLGETDTGFGLAVELVTTIPGVDADTAQALADKAHEFCPYSKATRGNIDVTVVGKPA